MNRYSSWTPDKVFVDGKYSDDPSVLPEGSVIDGATQTSDLEDSADFIVVGTGAGGATAGLTLAQAGYSVIYVEEGAWVRTKQLGKNVFPALKTLFREAGVQTVVGANPFTLVQGSCVGGSTVVNSAIALRTPEFVLDQWNREYGVDETITRKTLDREFDEIDKELSVVAVPQKDLGGVSETLREGAKTLGYEANPIRRYDRGCEATASCLTGCRSGRKLGMNVTRIPRSLNMGAKVYCSTRAIKVNARHGRATSLDCRFKSSDNPFKRKRLRLHAKRGIVIAASAVQSPGLLLRSKMGGKAAGHHFTGHPGTTVVAKMTKKVQMQRGATQGYNVTEFVEKGSFKIESLALPPELLIPRITGAGNELSNRILDHKNLANWAIIAKTKSEGRVRNLFGKDLVFWEMKPEDIQIFINAHKVLCELLFAAGAEEIYPTAFGIPTLTSPDQIKLWDDIPLKSKNVSLSSSHLLGGSRMGTDSAATVVGCDLQVHGVRGLYVMDSSVFPTNIGVNPQHSIMALAQIGAKRAAESPPPAQ